MRSFETYILDQAHLHPAFAPQDAIKLCYQATFGAEHLLQEAASVSLFTYFYILRCKYTKKTRWTT